MLCFCRQFKSSIKKPDYLALRLGFITKHKLPLSYNFHKYMVRSMEDEIQGILGITFGTLMTATLEWEGIPAYVIGLGQAVSAIVGISATFVFPIMHSQLSSLRTGAIIKVVENHVPLQYITRESQPLPAYQYFENVRNFLVAMEGLKLPAFEASNLERDALEAGSVAKVVYCVLALKSYHEHKSMNGGNGSFKPTRSPMVCHSGTRSNLHGVSSDSCRQLEMNIEAHPSGNAENPKLEDALVRVFAEYMADTKENMGGNFVNSFKAGDVERRHFCMWSWISRRF